MPTRSRRRRPVPPAPTTDGGGGRRTREAPLRQVPRASIAADRWNRLTVSGPRQAAIVPDREVARQGPRSLSQVGIAVPLGPSARRVTRKATATARRQAEKAPQLAMRVAAPL